MKPNVLIINEKDNVAISLQDIKKGEKVLLPDGKQLVAANDVPYSHKVALKVLGQGENIIKYGEIIGQAKEKIEPGDWIHTHNLVVQ